MAVASPPAPFRSVPPPQTMDSSSSSDSLPRDADLQPASKSEEYRQLFRLPPEVVLIQDFNCALQESILLQGHMYLFDRYICFYSNIFGFETKKIIPFTEVTSVRRAKTAGLFPNAIEIVASGRKLFFASFLSRDEALRLIEDRIDRWSQHSSSTRGSTDQGSKSDEIGSQSNGPISIEKSKSSELQLNASDPVERQLHVPVIEDRKHLNNKEDKMGPSNPEVRDIAVDKDLKPINNADTSMPERSNKWEEEILGYPGVPENFTKVAESNFPIKVEDFFNLFFSDEALGFIESFRKRCGDKDFKCTKWSYCDKLGCSREMSFQHPIKVYFGAKCGGCKELQSYRVYKNCHLVIQTSQEVTDVPYADYFKVEGLWDVQGDGNQSRDGCILRVHVDVIFSKKTVWKGKIEQSTIEECRDAFAAWIELAHELLKQKDLEKTEAATEAGNAKPLVGISEETSEPSGSQPGEDSLARAADTSPGPRRSRRQTIISSLSNLLGIVTTIASSIGAASAKLYSFLKGQGDLRRLMIISLAAILVLMQLSIVVLMSRPQQIHVIPQTAPANFIDLGDHPRGIETVTWLEKRVRLLRDEMALVESQLGRMRHEHMLLKAQLKDLELPRTKPS